MSVWGVPMLRNLDTIRNTVLSEINPTAEMLADDPATLIVLDTETTGLDHKTERMIEIGAVRLENGVITETFSTLVKPEVAIRHSSYRIHGISEEMVAEAPPEAEVLPKLLAFMDGAPFIAHSAVFDYSFVSEAHKRLYNKRWKIRKIDTLDMFRSVFPEEPSHGLSAMLARFGEHSGVAAKALSNRTPSLAMRSMCGVFTNGCPA